MRFLRQAGSFANSDMLRPNADSNSANERYVSSASETVAKSRAASARTWRDIAREARGERARERGSASARSRDETAREPRADHPSSRTRTRKRARRNERRTGKR